MRGLHGKAAIVTGAAQGIGKAIAERLTEEGAHVLWADINEEKVRQAQSATRKGIAMKVPPAHTFYLTRIRCMPLSPCSMLENMST